MTRFMYTADKKIQGLLGKAVRDYHMIEARGPENLPPAPPKHCERKGTMWGLQSHRVV